MTRLALAALCATLVGGCGDNLAAPPPLAYTDPSGGQLRLVKDRASTGTQLVLDLVVGDQPLVGYATGFDLPLDATRVRLGGFHPGTALDPGHDPVAATAAIPRQGPLASTLVVAQSQKASGGGAVATDATLPPATVLCSVELDLIDGAPPGVVFDGTAAGFVLESGGLRNKAGMTIVDAAHVAIGKLVVQ